MIGSGSGNLLPSPSERDQSVYLLLNQSLRSLKFMTSWLLYIIRRKDTQNIKVRMYTERNGIMIGINGKRGKNYRQIAKQFLPDYSERKHIFNISRDKFDNQFHISTHFISLTEEDITSKDFLNTVKKLRDF